MSASVLIEFRYLFDYGIFRIRPLLNIGSQIHVFRSGQQTSLGSTKIAVYIGQRIGKTDNTVFKYQFQYLAGFLVLGVMFDTQFLVSVNRCILTI